MELHGVLLRTMSEAADKAAAQGEPAGPRNRTFAARVGCDRNWAGSCISIPIPCSDLIFVIIPIALVQASSVPMSTFVFVASHRPASLYLRNEVWGCLKDRCGRAIEHAGKATDAVENAYVRRLGHGRAFSFPVVSHAYSCHLHRTTRLSSIDHGR